MDDEFFEVFGAIGWGEFWNFSEYPSSKLLTLEFMSIVKATKTSIYFHLCGYEFNFESEQFSACLGFINCTTNIELATKNLNKQEFWYEITRENIFGKAQPCTSHIFHPTLRFMNKWMGVTIFPRDDIWTVREIVSRILYAIVHKICISPIKAMVQYWIAAP